MLILIDSGSNNILFISRKEEVVEVTVGGPWSTGARWQWLHPQWPLHSWLLCLDPISQVYLEPKISDQIGKPQLEVDSIKRINDAQLIVSESTRSGFSCLNYMAVAKLEKSINFQCGLLFFENCIYFICIKAIPELIGWGGQAAHPFFWWGQSSFILWVLVWIWD